MPCVWASTTAGHRRASHVGFAGHDVPGLGFDEQDPVERHFGSGFDREPIDDHQRPRGDLFLPTTGFNNGEHVQHTPHRTRS